MPKLSRVQIENRTGFEVRSQKLIPPLRDEYHDVLGESVGGDAPKDFIRVYKYGHARKSNRKNWPAYIAKVGHKWYPNESITEHLLTRIGECLGFNMAKSQLRRADNQIRFLSRYFLNRDESLVHGAQIFSAYLQDKDFVAEVEEEDQSREFFTFKFILNAVTENFPDHHMAIMRDFVRLLAYDAIVGNNDRHFYNWGVIVHARNLKGPRLSPIYDSARALLWNTSEQRVIVLAKDQCQRDRYLKKYVKNSTPKTGWENQESLNHFELITRLYQSYPEYAPILEDLYQPDALQNITEVVETEFRRLMSQERRALLLDCLALRLDNYCTAIEYGDSNV